MEQKRLSEFPNKSWKASLKKLVTMTDQTGTVYYKPGSGKKRKKQIADNVDLVEKLVLSQENAPHTYKTRSKCKTRGKLWL